MKVAVHMPLGKAHPESGLMVALSNYIASAGHEVLHYVCDGIFQHCERDLEGEGERGLKSCFKCMREKNQFSEWAKMKDFGISSFLGPSDIENARQQVFTLGMQELKDLSEQGIRLRAHESQAIFRKLCDEKGQDFLRTNLVSLILATRAAKMFHDICQPELSLVASGRDFMSRTFLEFSKDNSKPVSLFTWAVSNRGIEISHPAKAESLACEIVLQEVTNMRTDVRTWPSDLTDVLDSILDFLGIPGKNQVLQVAQ